MYLNTFKRKFPQCGMMIRQRYPYGFTPKHIMRFPVNNYYLPIKKILYLPKPMKTQNPQYKCILKQIKDQEIKCNNCTELQCCKNLKITKKISLDKDDIREYLKMLKDIIIVIMKYYLQVKFIYRKPPKFRKK